MSYQPGTLTTQVDGREITLPKIVDAFDEPFRQSLLNQYPMLANADFVYKWFSKANFENARSCHLALGIAKGQLRRDQVGLFGGAILDLFFKDRAERASAWVGSGVSPARQETLGGQIIIGRNLYYIHPAHPLTAFHAEIPHEMLARIAKLYEATNDAPDLLMLGRSPQPSVPPILVAGYGGWIVRLTP